jgi:hypothetical protein
MVDRVAGTGIMLLFVAYFFYPEDRGGTYNQPTRRHIQEDGILQDPSCYY